MAESRTNGGGSRSTLSVHPAPGVSPEISTHESNPGDGGGGDADASGTNAVDVLKKGDTLGRYLVLEQLGAGAMGVVYAAYDPELDRKIAIKILRPHEGKGDKARRQERLVREAKAMAKLSHPNVGAIYDVGVHGDQVFLAMEFLSGGTLRAWMAAKKRPWREVVKMFIEVGKGLAGAHAEGLIHRDFKPDNVLLDKNGAPKVVDFGLVRLNSAALDRSTTGSMDAITDEEAMALPLAQTALAANLTRTGAMTGTPAYMAPEQFLGKDVDARTDQFAFCIALYEALYGERPFAGETIFAIAEAVTTERINVIPKNSDVPAWVRRCVNRGLRSDPAQRFPDFEDLLATLRTDPVARLRRRVLLGGTLITVVAGAVAFYQAVVAKRRDLEKQVAGHVGVADASLAEASAKRTESTTLRDRAFASFDNYQRDNGEDLWAQSLSAARAADAGYLRGIQALEAAVALAPQAELKRRAASAIVDYIQMDGRTPSEREDELRHLARYDDAGTYRQRLSAPATVHIETAPVTLVARLETYDPLTYQPKGAAKLLGATPFDLSLPPGLYRVTFEEAAGHVGFRFPMLLQAGEKRTATIRVPKRTSVPEGFVYVPEGRFLFGSPIEDLRVSFFYTVPLHAVDTGAFLISKFETTIGDWIAFLNTLPVKDRERIRPQGKRDGQGGEGGFVDLHQTPGGAWEIAFRATNKIYRAAEGRQFRYDDREQRVSQDWLKFPVSGVSPETALEYVQWLDHSGRVPGARLCTEREWERVARGADARDFPSGHPPRSNEANFDVTYGRKNGAYGPDEVGSHPASASPFDVQDILGNVWEITSSVLDAGQFVSRGGSFYQNLRSSVSPNREPLAAVTRDHTIGLRVCANARF